LNGVGLISNEDTTEAMTECFVEEFMRLGHNHKQILAMFHNPHYIGMNMALEKRGEKFVREMISEVFARRGRAVSWPGAANGGQEAKTPVADLLVKDQPSHMLPAAIRDEGGGFTDPMGAPIPDVVI
jgi:hypothetical protein